MAENPPINGAAPNNRKTSSNNFFRMRHRLQNNRNSGPRQPTVSLLIPQSSTPSPTNAPSSGFGSSATPESQGNSSTVPRQPIASFRIDKNAGPYSGWKLYFPEIGIFQIINVYEINFSKYFFFII